ncbi:endoplasmic reticulum oxidoreductin 1 [Chloropicon primus]|uniref:Endoplasmic reticulum oxidoreductin 1 n=1 Tax=Chloropicon primus TaxID=1764295 RepID=A0A5B8MY57_9CHLO|nr:endoplasmic reticulum oxidoreductin 1 [Chloropicon primus]|eukprot:QDZ25311.1 endoplasmic reticulum oxidoreductin 1 [Chloropicon primus]
MKGGEGGADGGGDSVRRALIDFKVKKDIGWTAQYSRKSSEASESTSSVATASEKSTTLRRAEGKHGGGAPISSLLRPALVGLAVVFLLPVLTQRARDYGKPLASSSRGTGGSLTPFEEQERCLLSGNVRDCSCDYLQVDALNEEIVRPKLNELVNKRFFSYFKVDLHCSCPFWPDDGMCSMPHCSVCECSGDEVPEFLRAKDVLECDLGKAGGARTTFSEKWESSVDRSVEKGVGGDDGMDWKASSNPWLFNGEETSKTIGVGSPESAQREEDAYVYVDLHLNPERFTGYDGEHAHRIWEAIYSQSCFHGLREGKQVEQVKQVAGSFPGLVFEEKSEQVVCKEKEIFYRLISGVHASITAHIAGEHPKEICHGAHGGGPPQSSPHTTAFMTPGQAPGHGGSFSGFGSALGTRRGDFNPFAGGGDAGCVLDEKHWGPNLKLFYNRLGKTEFKSRVENLYFTYLFTLQSAVKAAPYLLSTEYFTGHGDDDAVTKMLMKSLLTNVRLTRMCTKAFDEGVLWRSPLFEGKDIQRELKRAQKKTRKSKKREQKRRKEKQYFSGGEPKAGEVLAREEPQFDQLQVEMQEHFQNISRIMDCVGCEKCKLWGKLQILGLGTALKILFSVDDIDQLVLTRNEVIALLNLISRLSESIHVVGQLLCTLISQGYTDVIVPSQCRVGSSVAH